MSALEFILQSGLAAIIALVIAWLAKNFLVQLVASAVRFDFDAKLEQLRSELRSKAADLEALRSGVLSEMTATRTAIARRTMEAADKLWSITNEWHGLMSLVMAMGTLDFEASSANIEKEPKLREVFKMIMQDAPQKFASLTNAGENERPYISDVCWALFSAYRAIFVTAYSKVYVLANGVDARKFLTPQGIDGVLLAALPEHAAMIRLGPQKHQELADLLRTRILHELRNVIEGKGQDAAAVERAASASKLAEELVLKQSAATVKAFAK